jgi:hypothetical protein
LPPAERRQLRAALAWETASMRFHGGERIAALSGALKSLWLAHGRNPALAASLAKRIAR